MQTYRRWTWALLAAVAIVAGWARAGAGEDLAVYAGRYQRDDGTVDVVTAGDGRLALRPLLWTTPQYLRRDGPDSFAVEGRPDRRVRFRRDREGRVAAVEVTGIDGDGVHTRLAAEERLPIEVLLQGRGAEAAANFIAQGPCAVEDGTRLAARVLARFPTRVQAAVEALGAITTAYPAEVAAWSALGDGLVALGDREGARRAYAAALALNPRQDGARRALDRMAPASREPAAGWTLPFELAELFRAPTGDEVRSVRADWARRDLAPRDVAVVATSSLDLGHVVAELRVVSHLVHGARHFGAVLVPRGARPGSCPVVVEAKGVSWDYFPLDLGQVPYAPRVLADAQAGFVYVLPSFRGETLLAGGRRYASEGDRSDGWDGATDDAIAFLSAALAATPEADPARVCVLGKSRGGSVALLMGARDPRVDCVVDWVGPADWFRLMDEDGWSQAELVADGLRHRSAPDEVAGQFIERFLLRPIERRQDLAATRHHLIASSALYFADRLPRVQLHYGEEDTMVPAVNGRALVARMVSRPPECVESFFYADAGHDLDPPAAFARTRRFLLESLAGPASACR